MLNWDFAEAVNIAISSIIGLGLSYFAAWSYEKLLNKRKTKELEKYYRQYESSGDQFDYQRYEIVDGKISVEPVDDFMQVKYRDNRTFDFEIKSKGNKTTGQFVFKDFVYGQLYFFNNSGPIDFNSSDFIYSNWVEHKLEYFTGFFINTTNKATKYVMLRRRNWPH